MRVFVGILGLLVLSACSSAPLVGAPQLPQAGAHGSKVSASTTPVTKRSPAPSALLHDSELAQMEAFRQAERLLQQFIERAGEAPEYAAAVTRSQERIADIRTTLDFMEQGRRERGLVR